MMDYYDAYLFMGTGMLIFIVILIAMISFTDIMAARQDRKQKQHAKH